MVHHKPRLWCRHECCCCTECCWAPNAAAEPRRYELIDFADIAGVACPCGTARRAFADVADYDLTVHRTEIAVDARVHYHKTHTEIYYFLTCEPDAQMQLDDELVPIKPGNCLLIRPGVRHRALGRMSVLIVSLPKFDTNDEWFD